MALPPIPTQQISSPPIPVPNVAEVLGLTGRRDLKVTLETMSHLLYPADTILEPHLQGLTYLEVAVFKQMENAATGRFGSIEALEKLLDRILGKSTNRSENLNIGMNYTDFLKQLQQKDPIDVTESSRSRGGAEEIS